MSHGPDGADPAPPLGSPGDGGTIAAVATPPGEGGVAIGRVSGPAAVAIAEAVFRGHGVERPLLSHRACHGVVCWPRSGEPIDEVICLPLLAPRSYTGEDTIELQCHGGRTVARQVLAACEAAGARPAGPGEFTRRAFLNGRLSLDQAEAVADLIHAEDALAARGALGQLMGGLKREIAAVEGPLLALLADLEGGLEFCDEPGAEVGRERVARELGDALAGIDRLLELAPAGRRIREGIQVAIVGPPNVGKSSLFNALLGVDRALVDGEPGTTRDVVSAPINLDGCLFVLHDTAGLREGGGRVESLGMRKTIAAAGSADIILSLREAGEAAGGAVTTAHASAAPGAVVVDVMTKADAQDGIAAQEDARGDPEALLTSARTGSGMAELKSRLAELAARGRIKEAVELGVVLNDRHQQKLMECRSGLAELLESVARDDIGDEVTASLLASSLTALGEISGRVFTENLLREIFARFCVGK